MDQVLSEKRYSHDDVVSYTDKIVERLYESRNWASAEEMLRKCPDDFKRDVAFLLLQHIVIDPFGQPRREEMH